MYFLTQNIVAKNSEEIEENIRQSSLKRHTSLDLKRSAAYVASKDKVFLGYENESKISLLRISAPFEFFLPKLVATFTKNDFQKYRLRLHLPSLMLFLFLTVILILKLYSSVSSGSYNELKSILIFNLIFYCLLFIEYKLVLKTINRFIGY